MTIKEFQDQVIDACKRKHACNDQFKLLLYAINHPVVFLQVLRNNHDWCVENAIYTPELLLQLDAELLLRGGYATQDTKSVSFQPVEIGSITWSAFNHNGSLECINGSYYDFNEALVLDYGEDWRQSSILENYSLAFAPNMLGIYANTFGYVFEGINDHLFIPASGYRSYRCNTFYNVGSYSYLWTSSACDIYNGYILYIDDRKGTTVCNWHIRINDLPVRCVLK